MIKRLDVDVVRCVHTQKAGNCPIVFVQSDKAMNARLLITLGGLLAAIGVAAGAIGAHVLEGRLEPRQLDSYHTAVRYQTLHAVALVLVGLMAGGRADWPLSFAGGAFLLGIVLFSGGIYLWLATGAKMWVVPVPIGGVAFILGWLAVALAGWRMKVG